MEQRPLKIEKIETPKPLGADLYQIEFARIHHKWLNFAGGAFREVYEVEFAAEFVIKMTSSYEDYVQRNELEAWAYLCKKGYADYVPAHDAYVSETGTTVIVVERVEFPPDENDGYDRQKWDDRHTLCSSLGIDDLQPGMNSGTTSDGRFIVRDAGNWSKQKARAI